MMKFCGNRQIPPTGISVAVPQIGQTIDFGLSMKDTADDRRLFDATLLDRTFDIRRLREP